MSESRRGARGPGPIRTGRAPPSFSLSLLHLLGPPSSSPRGPARWPFWLKVSPLILCFFFPAHFVPSLLPSAAPSSMSFHSTFAVGDPQQLLWLYLGLDHAQRARLRCAWNGYNRLLHARTPPFRVPLGQSFEVDYYIDFQNRARVRVEDFRRDSLAGSPPVNEGGFPVYAAWDRLTGQLRPEQTLRRLFSLMSTGLKYIRIKKG